MNERLGNLSREQKSVNTNRISADKHWKINNLENLETKSTLSEVKKNKKKTLDGFNGRWEIVG